ncbi:coiled-coil domain-containing protein 102B [Varanus komodoensis]|uniref:coiled-coil domain-containing protein 102B n=1 Tax=Varanus komodoensis TaxID=61221 RepID=UPI001CF7DBFF|nr:coiled-coil domain-containing protein 102B [Varanus komodoensis]
MAKGVDTDELSQVMNSDSICNLMEDKRLLRNQPKEPYDIESRDYGRTCSVCNSNIISPRVLPSSYYYPSMYICNSSDWDICEELRLRELEEAKARAAQMEKTMRWWSDCTANWREKWSKVRAERNKAFEEGRQLKLKLEGLMKDLNVLKKINQGLVSRNEEMEAKTTWKKNFGSSEMCWMKEDHLGNLEKEPIKHLQNNILEVESGCQEVCATLDHHEMRINPEIIDCEDKSTPVLMGKSKDKPALSHDDEIIPISVFCLHLYESQKILQKEKKIRSSLEKEIEKVRSEKSLWKLKYEELRKSMQGSLKQFTVHKDLHQTEVETTVEDLEDATGARCQKDIKIWELQAQLERLQSESESEWERRKILETEKQELDRENGRLKTKLKDLQDLLDRKSIIPAVHLCGDLMNSHGEPLQENTSQNFENGGRMADILHNIMDY